MSLCSPLCHPHHLLQVRAVLYSTAAEPQCTAVGQNTLSGRVVEVHLQVLGEVSLMQLPEEVQFLLCFLYLVTVACEPGQVDLRYGPQGN